MGGDEKPKNYFCVALLVFKDFFLFHFSGKDLRNMPILEADVSNESSLNNMCQQAQLILNCVGPVRREFLLFLIEF
jgi:hypothetical protein